MAYGLDSARKQLQWRLTYAGKSFHTDVCAVADYFYLFNQRSVSSFWTKTTETDATTNAQSVGAYSKAGAIEGEPIFTQTGDAGQHAHCRVDSEAASLPHDRRPNRSRWSNFVWQTRARVAEGTFQCDGKGPESSLQFVR